MHVARSTGTSLSVYKFQQSPAPSQAILKALCGSRDKYSDTTRSCGACSPWASNLDMHTIVLQDNLLASVIFSSLWHLLESSFSAMIKDSWLDAGTSTAMPHGHPVHATPEQQAAHDDAQNDAHNDDTPNPIALNIGSPPDARRSSLHPLSPLIEGSDHHHQGGFSGLRPEARQKLPSTSTPSASIPYRRPTGFSSVGGSPQGEFRLGLHHSRSSPSEVPSFQRHSISGTSHASVRTLYPNLSARSGCLKS